MQNSSIIVLLALLALTAGIYFVIRLLKANSIEKEKAKQEENYNLNSLAVVAQQMARKNNNSTPVAQRNRQGQLITHGSVGNPSEPGGYVVDSEITQATPPSSYRVWYNFDDMFPKSTFGPDAYGDFFYPLKSGFYVRSGYW